MTITVGPMRYPKTAPWAKECTSSWLEDVSLAHFSRASENIMHQASLVQVQPRPRSFLLSCPRCKAVKNCSRITLYELLKWKCVRCTGCSRGISASKWLCACEKRWHLCSVHRQDGFHCKSMYSRSVSRPSNTLLEDHRDLKKRKKVEPLGSSTGSCHSKTTCKPSVSIPSHGAVSGSKNMARTFAASSIYMQRHLAGSKEEV